VTGLPAVVAFDARTGRLRLSQATFDRLAAWARGEALPDADLAALREAGAVGGPEGDAHPALAAGLGAVADPVCRLRLTLTDDAGRAHAADGWVRAEAAALLLDVPGEAAGIRDLMAFHPSFLPAAIARTVRLGPRPRSAAPPLRVAAEVLEDMLSADMSRRRGVADRMSNVLTRTTVDRLAPVPWRVWRAGMTWTAADGSAAGRGLRVADGGEAGLFLAESDGRQAALRPTTPTAVWRLLIRLLPETAELG